MGSLFSFVSKLFLPSPMHVVMSGMDNAGKTTILHMLKHPSQSMQRENFVTQPTTKHQFTNFSHKWVSITVWDMARRSSNPRRTHIYWPITDGIIMVVDSAAASDDGDFEQKLQEQIADIEGDEELREVPLLIYANKQDLPNAMTVEEVTERLGLRSLRTPAWHIQGVSATENPATLSEGLEWLMDVHKKRSDA